MAVAVLKKEGTSDAWNVSAAGFTQHGCKKSQAACVCVCVCVDLSKERPRSCRRLRHALLIHGSVSEVRAIACP